MKTRKLTTMAMFAALSVVLVMLVHFPLLPAAPFLEYDPGTIPILIATFAFGPMAGIGITVVTALIQGLTVSASGGLYGILMHIIADGVFVLVAGNIYNRKRTRGGAAIALVIGAIAMTVVMAGANLLITPLFMSMPVAFVQNMLVPAIIPFNLLKAIISGTATFILYKPISLAIQKLKVPTRDSHPAKN